MRLRTPVFASLICCLAYAQTGNVAGPSAGYLFDSSANALRQIRGIPGAALMSDAVDLGMSAAGAVVAPRGDSALAVAADGSVHLFQLANGAATEIAVQGLSGAPSRMVFSPSGSAAVLYRGNAVQILRGLPGSPDLGQPLPVPAVSGATAQAAAATGTSRMPAVAVSDDGTCVLIGRETSVALVQYPGGNRLLTDAHGAAQVAFAPGGHDAAVVTGGTLSIFQDVTGASTRQDFPGAFAPGGLAFSADGGKVVMAGLRTATVWDRATSDSKQVECDCRIDGITPMGSWFRLNEAGSGPVWILDAAAGKVYFVPARPGA